MFFKYSGGKLFTLQTTLDGILKSLITFRRHRDDHSCYQHIRTHLYVQLLLPEFIQAVDKVHECRETVADDSSNSSACRAARAVRGWRLAWLRWNEDLLSALHQRVDSNFPVFKVLL